MYLPFITSTLNLRLTRPKIGIRERYVGNYSSDDRYLLLKFETFVEKDRNGFSFRRRVRTSMLSGRIQMWRFSSKEGMGVGSKSVSTS